MGLLGLRARRNSIWRLLCFLCVGYIIYAYWDAKTDPDDVDHPAVSAPRGTKPQEVYSHRRPGVKAPPLQVRLENENIDRDDDDEPPAAREWEKPGEDGGSAPQDKGRPAPPGSDAVHVVFAFGSEYIVPAFVAVNSTLQNSAPAKRARLVLHLLVEEAIAQRVHAAFLRAFGNFAEVSTEKRAATNKAGENDWGEERGTDSLGRRGGVSSETGGTRPRIIIDPFDVTSVPSVKVWQGPQNLVHPLNYARFQLADIYPHLEKVIYVDPDVVVQADITDMWDGHLLNGKYVIAAAPSRTEKYAKFIIDNSIAKVDLNEKYFNAGVLMINLRLWKQRNKDAEIARWLELNRERPVYKFGSQPPLLLAFYRDYEPMSELWNFRHLGHKLTLKAADLESAYILHFNGPRKPWRSNGIETYRHYWANYYYPDGETHAQLVWGFEELQDMYRDKSHRACFTRPACQAEAERLGLEPVWIHIDAEPNKPKFFPLLNNFLSDMWRMQNVKFVHNNEYPWRFLWVRKQSDLPTRLAKLQFDWSKVLPSKHLVNFIPGVHQESYSKEALCRNTQQFALHHGRNSPALAGMLDCYILPEQAAELHKVAAQNPDKVWISKAFQESSGHGIELFANKAQLPPLSDQKPRLVQAYVEDPFLVHVLGGMRKTDLRLYAVVTSFDPLRVFLHPVGQVKVAQKAYTSDYTDMFAHISNKREYDTSNEELRKERQIDEFKYRLTLDDLADMMEPEKYRDAWERTEDLVVRAILAVSQNLGCKSAKYPHTCGAAYQLFGIDIVYDKDMNPHLMEINNDPGWNPYYERRRILMATQGGTAVAPNNKCAIPFVHNGKKHFECAKPEGDKSEGPWCYTDESQNWGYCNAKDESVHNQDALQRVFNVVYGDTLFLAGVLPYNKEFEAAVRQRYSYLCGNGNLPTSCRNPDVMENVVKMANEMQSMGNYRMVFPQKGYRAMHMPLLRKYAGPDDTEGKIDQTTLDTYDIFTEYFSYEFQDAALYRKKKSNR